MINFPSELKKIPQSYFQQNRSKPGKLVELYYETYESFGYVQHSQRLRERAIVYLPYGYSPQNQYNVFYLMHGGWSNETTYLGTPQEPHVLKNVLDNAIADQMMSPMIVVCPTYNNLSENDSSDYGLALQLTNNYCHELINDLLPAVEGHYSTYAEDTSTKALVLSRDHRAFCGFSMGSVTTWHVFQYAMKYFRYFLPSSGALTSDGNFLAKLVKQQGFGPNDFFVFAASGTKDFAYDGFSQQIHAMIESREMFQYSPNEQDGNLYYLVAPGGTHSPENALEDFYNGLIQLWKEN